MHVNGRKNSPRNRQQVRSENQLASIQLQLLENLSHMAMPENRVGGKIVRHRNEVGARGRFLARAGDARLRIGNDSLLPIDHVRGQQRSQRKNHRGGVAAGIGHQRRAREAGRHSAREVRKLLSP